MTDVVGADRNADPAVAQAVAASNAQVAAILAEDPKAFGDSLAPDVIVNSPLATINRRDDALAAFSRGFIRYSSRNEQSVWRLALRQATIAKVE
jgi:hypothetical protein